VEEINVFSGLENRLTFQRVYNKKFKCVYQLQMYPFDTQTCTVQMAIRELEVSGVEILPGNLDMKGDTVLTQYLITKWRLEYRNESDPKQGLNTVIVLQRRIMNELLTTFLPTLLILCIVYITNYFKAFFFEAVVTVNLTALLVLTTLFISVSGGLPSTAYVKMIDIWLIFAQMIPFFEVLLHTFIDLMRVDEEQEVNHHGKTILVGADGKEKQMPTFSRSSLVSPELTMVQPKRSNMVDRDEKQLVEARKQFYKNASRSNEYWVNLGMFTARTVIPLVVLVFNLGFWSIGLYNLF